MPGAGGGQAVELGQRRDVGRLVEHDQQRRIERAVRLGPTGRRPPRAPPSPARRRAPAAAAGRGRARRDTGRAPRVRERRRRSVGGVVGAGGHQVDERLEHRLGGRVDRAALPVVALPGRPGGLDRLGHAGRLEHVDHLVDLLGVHPADTSAMPRPPLAAAKSSGASSLAAVAYQNSPSAVVPDHGPPRSGRPPPAGPRPRSAAAGSGRPGAGGRPSPRPGRSTRPDRGPAGATLGVGEQVGLHAGRHHRAPPTKDGRDRQRGRLAALGRADHGHRLGPLGQDRLGPAAPGNVDPAIDRARPRLMTASSGSATGAALERPAMARPVRSATTGRGGAPSSPLAGAHRHCAAVPSGSRPRPRRGRSSDRRRRSGRGRPARPGRAGSWPRRRGAARTRRRRGHMEARHAAHRRVGVDERPLGLGPTTWLHQERPAARPSTARRPAGAGARARPRWSTATAARLAAPPRRGAGRR